LARAGADVLLHCRANRNGMAAVASRIGELGRKVHTYVSDLSDPIGQQALVDRVWGEQADVDIWVNNAGVDVLTGEAADWSFERKLEALWRLDVAATIRLSRLVGRRMKQRSQCPGTHTIINVGWDQAEWGMGGDSGEMFSAAKGAVMAFSRSLAKSLAPNVRVNCLAPGWIRTSWGAEASEYWQQRAARESLSGRWGTPEEVARVARFLASPAAQFVSGQVLHVNGGFNHGGAGS
jgi:3-oxoacyl-[acyl-carrier protein] reductase